MEVKVIVIFSKYLIIGHSHFYEGVRDLVLGDLKQRDVECLSHNL